MELPREVIVEGTGVIGGGVAERLEVWSVSLAMEAGANRVGASQARPTALPV
jgi:hypothetical protein